MSLTVRNHGTDCHSITYGYLGAHLGALVLTAKSHPVDKCGSNGLPLTPNSVCIYGRSQYLKTLRHPNICQFIDVIKASNERVFFISEHYQKSIQDVLANNNHSPWPLADILRVAKDILKGLRYLNGKGITPRNLCPRNLLLDDDGNVKLSNHGLYYATECGSSVNFPIGESKYLPPWVISRGSNCEKNVPQDDIWALGIVLLELALGSEIFPDSEGYNKTVGLRDALRRIVEYGKNDNISFEDSVDRAYERLSNFTDKPKMAFEHIPQDLAGFISMCLCPHPSKVPSADDLIAHPIFFEERAHPPSLLKSEGIDVRCLSLRCSRLPGTASAGLELGTREGDNDGLVQRMNSTDGEKSIPLSVKIEEDPLLAWDLPTVYYFWTLSSPALEADLVKRGVLKMVPSIFRVPTMVRINGTYIGSNSDHNSRFQSTVQTLDMSSLSARLKSANLDPFPNLQNSQAAEDRPSSPADGLPLVIRETDLDYQFERVALFTRILRGYPFTRPHLHVAAKKDIPMPLRGKIWAAILEVPVNVQEVYESIDKESPNPSDHQLAVDIPRCHQYDLLLSSPDGHTKLMRLLKAWIIANPGLVYWQGLDSVCAPFLIANFNDEAVAFGSLCAFVNRYLNNFFLKDNSMVMQEYLAVFAHLIGFHDPELGYHMHSIGFIPDLFAIPWFLTCFAHVFPLKKIMAIWDSLVLCGSGMVVCIGVAIMMEIRETLLSFSFEECILFFSDAPDVDLDQVIVQAQKLFDTTKPSMYARQHSRPACEPWDDEITVPPIPVLKQQQVPFISPKDFMELYQGYLNTGTSSKRTGPVLAIDIRSEAEFRGGHLEIDTVNITQEEALTDDNQCQPRLAKVVEEYKGKHIVIVASRGNIAPMIGEALLRLQIPKVCVLLGGVSALRVQGLLSAAGDSANVVPLPESGRARSSET
eukprot:m.147023 g.147023  ORF g.147023 m.147023 type:complete len:928 (+) comp14980_c0_seq2:288-3071(+)